MQFAKAALSTRLRAPEATNGKSTTTTTNTTTTTTTTTTIISEGPTRLDQLGVTLQRAGHHGQARNIFSSFPLRVLPIPASRPTPSGLFTCLALPPTEATSPVLLGIELGRAPNATPTVVSGTGVLKVREIIAYSEHRVKSRKVVPRQGAAYVTHSVVWRTGAS